MPKQTLLAGLNYVNVGVIADDGTGDDLRSAFIKVNENFQELGQVLITGYNYINLLDTPESYSPNTIVTINSSGNALVHRSISSDDISVDITNSYINLSLAPIVANVHTFTNDVTFAQNIIVQGNTIVKDTYINVDVLETENKVIVSNTDPAISTTTGALQVAGGVGVLGNVYADTFYGNFAGVSGNFSAGTGLIYTPSLSEFKISDTGVVADTYGNSSQIPVITVNAQGQLTNVTTVSITSITEFTSDPVTGVVTIVTANGQTFTANIEGPIGYTGSQGDLGYTGSRGDIGYTGSQGDIGYTGSQGDIGYTGSQGDLGYTGSQGDLGYTGSQGDIGYTGSAGPLLETIYNVGNITGIINFDRNNGSVQEATITGDFTINSIANMSAGQELKLIMEQDEIGSHTLTTNSSFKFALGFKTLSTDPGSIDIIEIFYDGITYYCKLTVGYA